MTPIYKSFVLGAKSLYISVYYTPLEVMENKMKNKLEPKKVLEDLIELSGKRKAVIGINTLKQNFIIGSDMDSDIERYFLYNKLIQSTGRDSRGDWYMKPTDLGNVIYERINEIETYSQLRDKYSANTSPLLNYPEKN
jgi:hypothetical protein